MGASKTKTEHYDVAIAGGGPVGLTLALALAGRGFSCAVVDAAASQKAAKRAQDSRAFFIAYGCWRIFKALGVDDALLPVAQPVTRVEAKGRLGGVSFLAEDCEGESVLGYMIEAADLIPALNAAAKTNDSIRLLTLTAIDAVTFGEADAVLRHRHGESRAALAVGCDGARSVVRQAAALRFEGWDYDAKAISTTVQLEKPHDGAARQIFLPGGPMAVLPLRENRANLIWTERAAVADALMALDEAGFEAELAKKAGDFLESARLAGGRHAFPLGLYMAEQFHAVRVALAGDAAHIVHPLGGQGLNLGLKDAAALVDVISEATRVGLDIGSPAALEPYTRWRRADVVASAAAMEGFARTFSAPLPIRIAAGLAMQAAGTIRQARKLFAREAGGDLGELPSLMRGEGAV